MKLHEYRQVYTKGRLLRAEMPAEPIHLFADWFAAAGASGIQEPNAMTLSTADAKGNLSARIVLLKEFNEQGFIFFTNYDSSKGKHLAENPQAVISFWWYAMERQVEIHGSVTKVTEQVSEEYFNSRPFESKLGAIISAQSTIIPDDINLEQQLIEAGKIYTPDTVKKPEQWGGYLVIPDTIEFWQGRPSRLHDRFLYTKKPAGDWKIERLSP